MEKLLQDDPTAGLLGEDSPDGASVSPSDTSSPALDRASAPVFFGRERELALLQRGVEEAKSGRGRLLLLTGDAGVGKTRTAEVLTHYAQSRGVGVLVGRCYQRAGVPPYWPWIQIIRSWLRGRNRESLATLGLRVVTAVAQIVPEAADLLPEPLALGPSDAESARFRLFDSVTRFLKGAAAEQPLLLVLDDLHWADRSSLLLLEFLVREVAESRLLVLGTYRDTEVGQEDALAEVLSWLRHELAHEQISLRGLCQEDGRRLLAAFVGQELPEDIVLKILRDTEGNPFFIKEILHHLIDRQWLHRNAAGRWTSRMRTEQMGLPDSVRDVIGRRIRRLTDPCREVLRPASVIGRHFTLKELEATTGKGREELVERLDEAETARIVRELPRGSGCYVFSHALISETLYEDLRGAEQSRLHRRVAEALEALHAEDLGASLSPLAFHYFHAIKAGSEVEKAIAYCEQAGDAARTQHAYEAAIGHYERALQALALQAPPLEKHRLDLLFKTGDACWEDGDHDRARETFGRAAEIAERVGSPADLARAALGFGGYHFGFEGGLVDEFAIGFLEKALAALDPEESVLRARVMARLAEALMHSDERRLSLAREAGEIARRVADKPTLARILSAVRLASWSPDNLEERLAITRELSQLAEECGEVITADFSSLGIDSLMELGDVATARRELESFARRAEALRLRYPRWIATVGRGMFALLEGRFDEAERLANEALSLAKAKAAQAFAVHLVFIRLERGGLDELLGRIEELARALPGIPAWHCALAWIHAELGHEAEARREIRELAEQGISRIPRDMYWQAALWALSEAVALLGDRRTAEKLYEELLPYAERWMVINFVASTGSLARSLGLLASTMSRFEEAERHFEEALARNQRMGARPWVARTEHDYARMLLDRDGPGDREKALHLLDRSIETAKALGMTRLLERAESARSGDPLPVRGAKETGTFVREGDYWTIAYGDSSFRLKHCKGLGHLRELLRHPGRSFHVLELANEGGTTVRAADAGPLLDHRAKIAYRARLEDLRHDLDEARSFNDPGRTERAEQEIAALTHALASAVGLGGRDRRAASTAERARVNVSRTIAWALKKIASNSPALGRHLMATIHTGTFCSYDPILDHVTVWEL